MVNAFVFSMFIVTRDLSAIGFTSCGILFYILIQYKQNVSLYVHPFFALLGAIAYVNDHY